MSHELEYTIENVFGSNYIRSSERSIIYNKETLRASKYLEIPIIGNIFEVPVFAFKSFIDAKVNHPNIEAVVAQLFTTGNIPRYKTVDRYMRDILIENFHSHHLIKLFVKQGNDTTLYYGTHGTVFDACFTPVLMCSWLIEKCLNGNSDSWKYKILRPILRIHPRCFLCQSNQMEKFIARKMPTAALNAMRVLSPAALMNGLFVNPSSEYFDVKIEIDECPFHIKTINAPDINISDHQLMQVAREHIEEMIQ